MNDVNEQVFSLTYSVGPIENDESRTWFLSQVRRAFETSKFLLIVSYAPVSIANTVRSIFPKTFHGSCYYHLFGKIKYYGGDVVKMYHKAAYAYENITKLCILSKA